MEIRAKAKYLKISPQKVRLLAFQFRQKKAYLAIEELNTLPQKSAFLIAKLIKSAMANAENAYNLKKDDLVISQIIVEEGPSYKRMKPRARGGRDIIKKRTSHILVILSSEEKASKVKKEIPAKETEETVQKIAPKMTVKEKKIKEKLAKKEEKPKKVEKKTKPVEKETEKMKEKPRELEKPTVPEKEKQPLKEKRPFFQRFFRRKGGA